MGHAHALLLGILACISTSFISHAQPVSLSAKLTEQVSKASLSGQGAVAVVLQIDAKTGATSVLAQAGVSCSSAAPVPTRTICILVA